jgi:hypothetical protein
VPFRAGPKQISLQLQLHTDIEEGGATCTREGSRGQGRKHRCWRISGEEEAPPPCAPVSPLAGGRLATYADPREMRESEGEPERGGRQNWSGCVYDKTGGGEGGGQAAARARKSREPGAGRLGRRRGGR